MSANENDTQGSFTQLFSDGVCSQEIMDEGNAHFMSSKSTVQFLKHWLKLQREKERRRALWCEETNAIRAEIPGGWSARGQPCDGIHPLLHAYRRRMSAAAIPPEDFPQDIVETVETPTPEPTAASAGTNDEVENAEKPTAATPEEQQMGATALCNGCDYFPEDGTPNEQLNAFMEKRYIHCRGDAEDDIRGLCVEWAWTKYVHDAGEDVD